MQDAPLIQLNSTPFALALQAGGQPMDGPGILRDLLQEHLPGLDAKLVDSPEPGQYQLLMPLVTMARPSQGSAQDAENTDPHDRVVECLQAIAAAEIILTPAAIFVQEVDSQDHQKMTEKTHFLGPSEVSVQFLQESLQLRQASSYLGLPLNDPLMIHLGRRLHQKSQEQFAQMLQFRENLLQMQPDLTHNTIDSARLYWLNMAIEQSGWMVHSEFGIIAMCDKPVAVVDVGEEGVRVSISSIPVDMVVCHDGKFELIHNTGPDYATNAYVASCVHQALLSQASAAQAQAQAPDQQAANPESAGSADEAGEASAATSSADKPQPQ